MAICILCTLCHLPMTNDRHDALVQYMCGHVEHEDCYLENHPHNLVCLICGTQSTHVLFK